MPELVVDTDGTIRFIFDPTLAKITQGLGEVSTRRASHVEPTEELSDKAKEWLKTHRQMIDLPKPAWWADLTPMDGPVLGPYPGDGRQQALDDEVEWLKKNYLYCESCTKQESVEDKSN